MYEWELWLNAKDANIIKIVNKYQQIMLIVPTKKMYQQMYEWKSWLNAKDVNITQNLG